jgi:hypothetical protein
MKKFTFLKGFLSFILVAIGATQLSAQTASITVPAAATTTITAGGTVTFTATRTGNFPGSGNSILPVRMGTDWPAVRPLLRSHKPVRIPLPVQFTRVVYLS